MCVQDYKLLRHVEWVQTNYTGATGVFASFDYDEARFGWVFSTTSTSSYEFTPENNPNVFSSLLRVGATGSEPTKVLFTDCGPLVWQPFFCRAASSLDCVIWEGFLPTKYRDLAHYLEVDR